MRVDGEDDGAGGGYDTGADGHGIKSSPGFLIHGEPLLIVKQLINSLIPVI
jgi:hypothetical protein